MTDIHIDGFAAVAQFNNFGPGFIRSIGMEGPLMRRVASAQTDRRAVGLLAHGDFVTPGGQAIDAVDAAVVRKAHKRAAHGMGLRPPLFIELQQIDTGLDQRLAVFIGDPAGEDAAAFDGKVDIVNALSFVNCDALALIIKEAFSGNHEPRSQRQDEVGAGGDAGQLKTPIRIAHRLCEWRTVQVPQPS